MVTLQISNPVWEVSGISERHVRQDLAAGIVSSVSFSCVFVDGHAASMTENEIIQSWPGLWSLSKSASQFSSR